MSAVNKISRRICDLGLILVILPLAIPVFVVLALAIRLGSPGPVLLGLCSTRRDGRSFTAYRFRSVYVDARARAFRADCAGAEPAADPRVTPVGAFMLQTGLNRLPQLLNILAGNMTFFGGAAHDPAAAAATLQARGQLTGMSPQRS